MQFNSHATNDDIISDANFILTGSYAGTSDYHINDQTRNGNRWLDRAIGLILQADAKWEYDDSNWTDLPIGTTSLVANQKDYSISGAGFLKVLKAECKDSSGKWHPLTQIDTTQRKRVLLDDPNETAGTPRQFDLRYNSIFLDPKPSYASSGGLKIYSQRICDYFVPTDTTKEPGFAKPFHRLISYGIALDYAKANTMVNKSAECKEAIKELEAGLVEHYSNRNKDFKNRITLEKEDYGVGEVYPQSVDWSS